MPRVYPDDEGHLRLGDGDYGLDPRDGNWYVRPPGQHMGNLEGHEVEEHEDGTITVKPSILLQVADPKDKDKLIEVWHGYLTAGVFKSV